MAFFSLLCSPTSLHLLLSSCLLFPAPPTLASPIFSIFLPLYFQAYRKQRFVRVIRLIAKEVPCLRNNYFAMVLSNSVPPIDLHGYPIVFRGNGIRWQGRDYFPIGYFYALSSLPSSYSHLIDQQGPVPSSNKCFPGLPTTFLSIPSHGDISVEIARRVANDRKGWRENEGKGRGDRRGMNKIGDLEYFALGSSGHFTRHFNP